MMLTFEIARCRPRSRQLQQVQMQQQQCRQQMEQIQQQRMQQLQQMQLHMQHLSSGDRPNRTAITTCSLLCSAGTYCRVPVVIWAAPIIDPNGPVNPEHIYNMGIKQALV